MPTNSAPAEFQPDPAPLTTTAPTSDPVWSATVPPDCTASVPLPCVLPTDNAPSAFPVPLAHTAVEPLTSTEAAPPRPIPALPSDTRPSITIEPDRTRAAPPAPWTKPVALTNSAPPTTSSDTPAASPDPDTASVPVRIGDAPTTSIPPATPFPAAV